MRLIAAHLIAALLIAVALLAPARAQNKTTVTLLFAELKDDARYEQARMRARYLGAPTGRPYSGAEVALKEVRFHGAGANATFALEHAQADTQEALAAAVAQAVENGTRYVLIDAPAEAVRLITQAAAGKDVLLFNVSASADALRGEYCAAHLLHTAPSLAMEADALAQYLAFKRWRRILMLEGPDARDKEIASVFRRAAKRFGLTLAGEKTFVRGQDPRERDQNNLRLLTQGTDYDVLFIADWEGEFGADAQHAAILPRPVTGSGSLAGLAWHWSWQRHGAPQLNKRFEKAAGRDMTGYDWAAWVAVKAVAEAVQRTGSADFAEIRDHLLADDLVIDGFKGVRVNFRAWDGQLRQPMLIATNNRVVARAPIEGFLHPTDYLDTLGYDRAESGCDMSR